MSVVKLQVLNFENNRELFRSSTGKKIMIHIKEQNVQYTAKIFLNKLKHHTTHCIASLQIQMYTDTFVVHISEECPFHRYVIKYTSAKSISFSLSLKSNRRCVLFSDVPVSSPLSVANDHVVRCDLIE